MIAVHKSNFAALLRLPDGVARHPTHRLICTQA